MRKDARKLDYYPAEHFNYVYSSHLLEEIQDTEPTLKEWVRVLKPGGYLVLYQILESRYFPIGHPNCNGLHKHHFTWESLWAMLEKMDMELVLHDDHPETKEWSFELVVRKNGAKSGQIGPNPATVSVSQEHPAELPARRGISILVPTLNRPVSMHKFALAVDSVTTVTDDVEIIYGVHEEDKTSIEKGRELGDSCKVKVRIEIISRYPDGKVHLSHLWNQLYPLATYDILGFFGDDVLFKTPGWDLEVRKEFEKDPSVLVSCNDVHIQKGRSATLFFTHKSVHDKVGFYLPPSFRRWYMDAFWDTVYRNAGKLHYREDIVTEHIHPDVFPEKMDDTYRALGGHTAPGGLKEEDKAHWLSEENRAELRKCIDLLKKQS